MALLASKVYSEELYDYKHGLPLWTPNSPDGETFIGDVGYIDDQGSFRRLFNATVGSSHPCNPLGTPANSSSLKYPSHLLKITPDYFEAGKVLASTGVSTKEGAASLSGYVRGFASRPLTQVLPHRHKRHCHRRIIHVVHIHMHKPT